MTIRNERPQKFVLKFPTTKFHEDPPCRCRAVTRDTNKQTNSRRTQTQQQLHVSAHIKPHAERMDSGKNRAQKWLSKTKAANMCRKKGPIKGHLDNNEHNVKWRRQCAPRQWAHRHTRPSHFERSYGHTRTDGERHVTCRTGEDETWREGEPSRDVHRTSAQTMSRAGNAVRNKQNVHMRASKTQDKWVHGVLREMAEKQGY